MSSASFEFRFHEWLATQLPRFPGELVGVGDDAAVLAWPAPNLVVSHDTLCDGVHFLSQEHPPELIGRKALAVSLSDLAAMGAKPIAAVISLVLPKSWSLAKAEQLMTGIRELALEFDVAVVGGDTNRWDQGLVAGTTVLGTCRKPWRLQGARAGDLLLATGAFGGSLAGHHLMFEPRCRIAWELANRFEIHAATDVSDSLSVDLNAICEASRVGCRLKAAALPIREACRKQFPDHAEALRHALSDGEDFELLLAVSPETWMQIQAGPAWRGQLQAIGEFIPGSEIWLEQPNGEVTAVEVSGYEH